MLGSQLFWTTSWGKRLPSWVTRRRQRAIRLWGFIRRIRNRSSLSIPQGFTNPRQRLETSWWSRPIAPFVKWIPFSLWCQQMSHVGRAMTWLSNASRLLRCRLFLWLTRLTRCTLTNSWRKSMTSVVRWISRKSCRFQPFKETMFHVWLIF